MATFRNVYIGTTAKGIIGSMFWWKNTSNWEIWEVINSPSNFCHCFFWLLKHVLPGNIHYAVWCAALEISQDCKKNCSFLADRERVSFSKVFHCCCHMTSGCDIWGFSDNSELRTLFIDSLASTNDSIFQLQWQQLYFFKTYVADDVKQKKFIFKAGQIAIASEMRFYISGLEMSVIQKNCVCRKQDAPRRDVISSVSLL